MKYKSIYDESFEIRCARAKNTKTEPELLRMLSKDPYWLVEDYAAGNIHTPIESLLELLEDKDFRIQDEVKRNQTYIHYLKERESMMKDNSEIQGMPGRTAKEVENLIFDYVLQVLSEYDITDIEIKGVSIYGSRNYGGALETSDLDVLIEYDGDIREDDLFCLLHNEEDPFEIDGIEIDINPITESKSGTIEQFLERNKDFRKRNCLNIIIQESPKKVKK